MPKRGGKRVASWQQYVDLDVRNMSDKELKSVVNKLAKTANERIKTLDKRQDEKSFALKGLKQTGGKISTAGKTGKELREEYRRAADFLKAKTSTAKGIEQYRKELKDRLGGKELSKKAESNLWDAWAKLKERYPDIFSTKAYNKNVGTSIQQFLANGARQGMDAEELILSFQERQEYDYETAQGEAPDMSGEFFELYDDDEGLPF